MLNKPKMIEKKKINKGTPEKPDMCWQYTYEFNGDDVYKKYHAVVYQTEEFYNDMGQEQAEAQAMQLAIRTHRNIVNNQNGNMMREFSRELLSFQQTCNIPDMEFAGMLVGAAATVSQKAGISVNHAVPMFIKCYDQARLDDQKSGVANDQNPKG